MSTGAIIATILVILGAWIILGFGIGILVGRSIKLRDQRDHKSSNNDQKEDGK